MTTKAAKRLRCAVYTRVSTEYGLEQEFNSLDAQREACEAYITSQKHEGWTLLPARYDDGGFSGGSMNRPALQQLLAAIRQGQVDVIVVYKVDRLTRSLADFAKLVELFDGHQVSFVSVTQSFNTTSSMGRLTLNVLLSFAQFEREVTGERIRDKIAASKKKGMRMGGPVPLGYQVKDKKLVVHEPEAEQVRLIFSRYLELKCLTALARDLRERGIVTKVSRRRDGSIRGGIAFTKGPLAYLLRNRTYVGEVIHKGQHYPGEQEPIVSRHLFDAVQDELSVKAHNRGTPRINRSSLLVGLLFDDRGNRMTPTTSNKGGARYRYYTSAALQQGRKDEAGSVSRVPAPDLEAMVLKAIADGNSACSQNNGDRDHASGAELMATLIDRVIVRRGTIEIVRRASEGEEQFAPIIVPWSPVSRRCRREIIGVEATSATRPLRSETRARLVEAIAKARQWLNDLLSGDVKDTHAIAARKACSERSVRMTINLAFLSPAIVKAAVEGRLPYGAGLSRLIDAPLAWTEQQRSLIGASP
ncbi:recombinase family protein [Microvirga sp. CF3062]|uniref:recombinase family protein n=1 Tax=Microvirga sp. CF3062 TaxID=3110182 RepID=UPI002E773E2C|nr:recombinase family protein [Microvirga sp. CF3062]MEE1657861.1 recombinase family protein [Microvirga sp. CF3062]